MITLLLFLGATGQVGADSALRLAAGRDGRPDAGVRADPCRDDGDGRRVHDRAQRGAVQPRARTRSRSSRSSACATALMAGTIGLVQNDIKRVLAYSTVSQLGYMFLAMGVGAFAAGIFHLYTHAFFKALLFLGSGAVIHALARRAGPAEHGRAAEGAADHVLDVPDRHAGDRRRAAAVRASSRRTRSSGRPSRAGITCCGPSAVVTAFLTATYMFRLLYLAFFGERRRDRRAHTGTPRAPHDHGARRASSRRAARDGHRAGRAGDRIDRRPATSACPNVLMRGGNRIEAFLEPSFRAPGRRGRERAGAGGRRSRRADARAAGRRAELA